MISPQDIKIDADGSYIVTDITTILNSRGRTDRARSRHPTKLLRVSPSGNIQIIAQMPRARFRAVTLAPDHGYLVVDMVHAAIYHYEPRGGHTTLREGTPFLQPSGVAVAE